MALYGKLEYWEERYEHSGDSTSYEWLQTYGDLRHLLSTESLMANSNKSNGHKINNQGGSDPASSAKIVADSPPYFPSYEECRVLILGCGNSMLAADMRDDGWCGPIVNVDFSTVVIEQMKKRFEERGYYDGDEIGNDEQATTFVCEDITEGLPFDDESFDLVIVKGTLDAILCGNGGTFSTKKVVSECARVLSTGYGCLFLVSYGNPDSRVEYLEHQNDISFYWHEVSIHKRVGEKTSYIYICRKQWTTSQEDEHVQPEMKQQSFEENAPNDEQPKDNSIDY